MIDVLDKRRARSPRRRSRFRDAMDELRRLLLAPAPARRSTACTPCSAAPSAHDIADAALADGDRGGARRRRLVPRRSSTELYGELDAHRRADESGEPSSWHRARSPRCSASARRVVHRRRPRRHPAADPAAVRRDPPPDELPVVAWSAGAMALTERGRALPRLRAAGRHGGRGLDRGLGRVPRRRRAAARPPAPAARRPRARCRSSPAGSRDAPLPAARRRRRRRASARRRAPGRRAGAPRHRRHRSHGVGRCGMTAPCEHVAPADARLADQPAARPAARSTAPTIDRFLERHGCADRRGRAGDLPLARRGRRGAGCGTGSSGCRTRCRCDGSRDTDLWYGDDRAARGVAGRVPVRDPQGRAPRAVFNDPLNPRLAHGPFGVAARCARPSGYQRARLGAATTRRPARATSSRSSVAQQGAAPRAARSSSTCRPASDRAHALPAARSCTTAPTTSTTPRAKTVLDNLIHRARGRRAGGRVRPAAATGSWSTPTTRRTPGSSPASWCRYLAERLPLVDTPDGAHA